MSEEGAIVHVNEDIRVKALDIAYDLVKRSLKRPETPQDVLEHALIVHEAQQLILFGDSD
ncbi:hypothetical protein MF271_06265 [Deinococcus sp. KNUC1210]|uniref:hypothetical protein n=1 Tax=Deinococcus sp. KNUC1210 TaxID=2917691 RepID=UPI001EF0A78D|nr:hypothetical protein [Deinococcus sp. KNUC1210]ULH16214.1 hypothetical protein MF271_06265 [Deinococcus sp. KNUC1210]